MKNRGYTFPKHGTEAKAALPKNPTVPANLVQTPKQSPEAQAPARPDQPDTRDWLTRSEAADMLACSGQTLANYERKGTLRPQYAYRPDGRGVEHRVIVYNPHELKKLAIRMNRPGVTSPRHAGEITARTFELIEEGRSGREIIRELRLTVEELRELREKWRDEGGSELIISPEAKERLEQIVGPFSDVTQLVELVASELFITSNVKATLEQLVGPFENVHALIGLLSKKAVTPS